jgi:serine/threonine-protein kinase HipA
VHEWRLICRWRVAEADRLIAWLHDEPVAELVRNKRRLDRIDLHYDVSAIELLPLNTPVLSCSLPLSRSRLDATAFVDGVLPEGEVRRYLAERARLASHDSFGLIAHYGRDIAGAVQFIPAGQDATAEARWSAEALDDHDLDELVVGLPTNPLAIVDESELSLAGLQNKMLLVRLGQQWGRPLGGKPSTHILKRDHSDYRGIVAAECEALAIARRIGLTTVDAWIESHGGFDCLIVERFDRVVDENGTVVGRVHQEDSCQALGLPASRKYEIHHGGGGPELSQIASLLDRYAADPLGQLDRLAEVATYTIIIGNADAHGKNTAFLLDRDGTIELAPLYDTVPTVLWPTLRREAAMTIGGAVGLDSMNLATIEREARRWQHSPVSARASATRCAEAMRNAVGNSVIDPDGRLAARVMSASETFLASADG